VTDPRTELVGRGYDARGEHFAEWRDRIVGDPRREWEAELVSRLQNGARVLELGCGAGVPDTQRLAARFQVTGVDISAEQVRRAQAAVPDAEFVQADFTALERYGGLDRGLAWCTDVLLELPTGDEHAARTGGGLRDPPRRARHLPRAGRRRDLPVGAGDALRRRNARDTVTPVGAVNATSPDGRTWEIEAIREPFSFGERRSRGTVVMTVLLVAFTVFVAFLSLLLTIGFVIILLVWVAERVSNHLRPRFRARTQDRPAEEATWKATRFRRRDLQQRIVRVIESGSTLDVEPRGLTLLSHRNL
jgi:SAM-dependent methyltransferase